MEQLIGGLGVYPFCLSASYTIVCFTFTALTSDAEERESVCEGEIVTFTCEVRGAGILKWGIDPYVDIVHNPIRFRLRDGNVRVGYTADVHVFEDSQQWEKSIPAMPSPRSAAAVLSHNNSLVVGGGSDTRGEPCATIFVYSCLTSKWSSPGSLPFACWRQSSVVLHNSCFVAGGYYGLIFNQQRRSVISIILPSCSVVENLPDMPHYDSTIATIDGSILAVGGIPTATPKSLFAPYLYSDRISSEVYAYCPTASTWTRIGDLPAPRNRVATATLPSGELLVMGGGKRESNFCDTVFMGSIETIE